MEETSKSAKDLLSLFQEAVKHARFLGEAEGKERGCPVYYTKLTNVKTEFTSKLDQFAELSQIRSMLEDLITFWRDELKSATTEDWSDMAENYTDAYQTVYKNIFGSVFPEA